MRTINALFLLVACMFVHAQAPQGINYQGIVRDNSGNAIINQPIGLKFIIHSDSLTGPAAYAENHTPTSDQFGSITAIIGQGSPIIGNFSTINWGNGSYFNEVLIDVSGGTNYVSMGTSQLMSVPYALHANSANTANNNMGLQNFIVKINGIPVTDTSLDFAMVDLNTFITKNNYVFNTTTFQIAQSKTDSIGELFLLTDDTLTQSNVYLSASSQLYRGRVFKSLKDNTAAGQGNGFLHLRQNELLYVPLNAVPVLLPIAYEHTSVPSNSSADYRPIFNKYYYQAFPNNPTITGVDLPHDFTIEYSRH